MKQIRDFLLALFSDSNFASPAGGWSQSLSVFYIVCTLLTFWSLVFLPLIASRNYFQPAKSFTLKSLLMVCGFSLAWMFLLLTNKIFFIMPSELQGILVLVVAALLACSSFLFFGKLNRPDPRFEVDKLYRLKNLQPEGDLGEQRFKSLVQEGGDLIAILDDEANYHYVSPTSKSILGIAPEEFLGRNAFEYIHPEDSERIAAGFLQLKDVKQVKVAPYRFRNSQGEYRWIETVVTNLKDDPAVKGFVANSRDVSDLIAASRKIEESELQYSDLVKNLPIGLYTCDTEGRILLFNKAATDLWGRIPEVGKDLWCGSWKIFKPDGSPLPHDECPMAIALKEKKPVKGIEIMIRCPDGQEHYLLPYPSPLFNPAGELTGALNVLIDITERKKIYAQLVKTEMDIRNFAKQQNNLLEDERSRIAREIHDEFGQQLAGIKMSLSTLIRFNQHSGKVETNTMEMIRSMIEDVDNTMQSLRKFATELRPGILDTLGLVASIEWLVEEFENKSGISCRLSTNVKNHYFDKEISTCFFRICQEAFTNILKHAQATHVNVEMTETSKYLKLSIVDNGKGIVLEQLNNPFSMGILGMRERANLIGARLSIGTERDSGTIINLIRRIDE